MLKALQVCLEVVTEINLAVFYLRGSYYDLVKRLLGIRYVGCVSRLCMESDINLAVAAVFYPGEPSCSPTVIFITGHTHRDTTPPPPYYIFAQ
jgi:hypothetical protein